MANVTYVLPASSSLCCVLHLGELCAGVRVWFAGQPRPTLRRKATAVIFTSSTVILSIKAWSQAPCCNSQQTIGCAAVLASFSSGQRGEDAGSVRRRVGRREDGGEKGREGERKG